MGLVDLQTGQVLRMQVFPTEKKSPIVFEELLHHHIEILKPAQPFGYELAGIGIGVSGFVFEDGTVDSTYGFLEFMEDYPLAAIIEKRHHAICRIDNDARLVALGEAVYGEGKGYNRVLMLTLGTGLGVGMVVGQKLDGTLPYAHMAGHMTITGHNVTCYCGKTGCLESLVSATGISKLAAMIHEHDPFCSLPLDCEEIFFAADRGDRAATGLVEEVVRYLRSGIGNYVNVFAPEIIVLGGGVANGLQRHLNKLYEPDLLSPFKAYKAKIAFSRLGEEAGVLGGALLFKP
ncbi:glucose kinase [Dyadobacter beijingensis]|uniref:Glucose kinase n=2 Tax=Dyadobacter beijingensis TaxID=365489 RepID=A0ABQ2HWL9_9BACT|nr:glucose kinase [Dyadobacter beijingensis]